MSSATLGGLSSSGAAVHPYEASEASDNISADSFVVRDVHERRQRRREEVESGAAASGADGRSSSASTFFSDFLQQLRYCCAGRGGGAQKPSGATPKSGGAAVKEANAKVSAENGWEKNASAFCATGAVRMQTYSATASSGGSTSRTSELASERRDRFAGDLSRLVLWRVSRCPPSKNFLAGEAASLLVASSPATLTSSQAAWTALLWAVRVEGNTRLSARFLEELLREGAEQPLSGDLGTTLKKEQAFKVLDFERKVQGVIAEDVLGEFTSLLYKQGVPSEAEAATATASPGVGVFMVVQKGRVFGLHGRMRGELLDFCLFDPMPTEREVLGASFMGFKT